MKAKMYYPGIKWILISVFFQLNFLITVNSQKKSAIRVNDFSLITSVSGNGFGLHYNPAMGLRFSDRMIISGGAVLRADDSRFAGWMTHGSFILMKPEDSFTGENYLYSYLSFEKYYNQYFSRNWVQTEEIVSRFSKNKPVFEDVSFKGFECSAGFGVGREVSDYFSLAFEWGASFYKVERNNYHNMKLYHEPTGFNLHLSMKATFKL